MVYNNQLICYYSDERDPSYNQKLVYQATSDLVNWGSVVNVVAEQTNSNGRSFRRYLITSISSLTSIAIPQMVFVSRRFYHS
jgi:hypothetical protein